MADEIEERQITPAEYNKFIRSHAFDVGLEMISELGSIQYPLLFGLDLDGVEHNTTLSFWNTNKEMSNALLRQAIENLNLEVFAILLWSTVSPEDSDRFDALTLISHLKGEKAHMIIKKIMHEEKKLELYIEDENPDGEICEIF